MNNKSYIKSLLVLNNISVEETAEEMTKLFGEKYIKGSLYGKLSRNSLT